MDKKVKTLNESQLCDLITNITKQYIMEAMELHPEFGEVGEKPYEMEQDYFRGPDSEGMPVDNLGGDEEFYDDFFENPAEESFPEEEPIDKPTEDIPETYDELLESKNKVDMEEKQNKLLNFITENWDNHANNLIK